VKSGLPDLTAEFTEDTEKTALNQGKYRMNKMGK